MSNRKQKGEYNSFMMSLGYNGCELKDLIAPAGRPMAESCLVRILGYRFLDRVEN